MAAPASPVLQQLNSRNQDAIARLLRGHANPNFAEPLLAVIDRADSHAEPAPAGRWMAGVYIGNELTSFVQASDCSEGYVEARLFVDANWRRQGIGTLLLKGAMDWAALQQASTLRLVCARSDWPMRHLAGKFGARLDLMLGHLIADIVLGPGIVER